MAVLHRALLTWFLAVIFLILIVIRLDPKSNWSWFIVFIPMWIFDGTVLIYSIVFMINRCKSIRTNIHRPSSSGAGLRTRDYCSLVIKRRVYFVIGILFKMTAQILLCIKLEVTSFHLPLYYVFIPLWCLLAAALIRVFYMLYTIGSPSDEYNNASGLHRSRSLFGGKSPSSRGGGGNLPSFARGASSSSGGGGGSGVGSSNIGGGDGVIRISSNISSGHSGVTGLRPQSVCNHR